MKDSNHNRLLPQKQSCRPTAGSGKQRAGTPSRPAGRYIMPNVFGSQIDIAGQ